MASAFQALPPPGPPPPGVVYPTTVTNQSSSHSNGSFGMVFIVLAIILVVSALACFLGRLCNKRSQRGGSDQPRANSTHNNKYHHNHGPDPRFSHDDHMSHTLPPNGRANERDVEFGFGPNEPGFDRKASSGHMPPNGRSKERDEEFGFGPADELGFDKKIPKIKIVPRDEGRGQMMPPRNGDQFGGRSMGSHMPRMMESPRNFR